MSELRVDNIVDMGGSGAPQLRKGASVTGISTITQAVVGNATINAGGINATGIVTSSSNKFVGDLASGNITAGVMTATSSVVASNITINSGGVNASGIVSATSYQGSGANLTGIGLTIAPLMYNPDPSAVDASRSTGIGLTFNQRVSAGTGNVTLSLVSVGSTLVENFSVGSSVTYNNDADPPNITITPSSSLSADTVYAISYPSGAFTQSGAGGSSVGIAYTFDTEPPDPTYKLFGWGDNAKGELGQNEATQRSSPVQIGSESTWTFLTKGSDPMQSMGALKSDGTMWLWGNNEYGQLAQNDKAQRSSPVQVPGTTWGTASRGGTSMLAAKTDGTLWSMGYNNQGQLGQNNRTNYSSPVQIPGTTWSADDMHISKSLYASWAIKTDGTLWAWGHNQNGQLGLSDTARRSSPVQVPGTTWRSIAGSTQTVTATKTDGTLWSWGNGYYGGLGVNTNDDAAARSSPVQVPGTTWSTAHLTPSYETIAVKTDGTLWSWGYNGRGGLGQNNRTHYSSPVQIPGTTWSTDSAHVGGDTLSAMLALKTDGTLWAWGPQWVGELGLNQAAVKYSSPVQVPGTTWGAVAATDDASFALKT